jgi:iron(III) transport system permease protein
LLHPNRPALIPGSIPPTCTSHIVLLATRDTITLSLLALEFASGGTAQREEAGIIGLIIVLMTVGVALVARSFGSRVGVRHE